MFSFLRRVLRVVLSLFLFCFVFVVCCFIAVDIMKSKSNPDILKMAAVAAKRSERTLRSKVSLKVTGKSSSACVTSHHTTLPAHEDVLVNSVYTVLGVSVP